MFAKLGRISKYFISFLIASLFLFFAFKNIKIDELILTLKEVNPIWILIFFICVNISHLLRAWRWIYLLKPLKDKISLRNSFAAVNVGFAVNNIIPRGGELVRPYSIYKTEGISVTSAFSNVVIERMLDSVSFLLLAVISFIVSPDALIKLFPNLTGMVDEIILVLIILVIIFLYLIVKFEKLILILKTVSKYLPKKIENKINEIILKLIEGSKINWNSKLGRGILLSSFAINVFYVFEMYLIFFAFKDFPKENLLFQTGLTLWIASSIAYLLPSPSGIGTYHVFVPFVLNSLYGVSQITAISYAVFTHSIGYLTTSLIGGFYFFKDKLHFNEVINQKKENK